MPLPASAQDRFTALLALAPRDDLDLRALVEAHRSAVLRAWAQDPFVDRDLAERVAEACLALLDAAGDHAAVRAACLYFAATDDAEHDTVSVVGFDDDAAVVAHAATLAGRPDLARALGAR